MNPVETLLTTHVELIGYLGSLFVLISFIHEGKSLRVWNTLGAGLWLVYGIIVGSGSIQVLNACIVIIHLRKLSIERRRKSKRQKNG